MPETFAPTTWSDGTGGGTPITASQLNRIEAGVESMDDRVAAIETGKVLNAVTDFGAVGDGTTNNNTALNNAVAAALSQKKALYVPAGRYLRTTTWDLRGEHLHVFGDGPEQTIILEGMGNSPAIKIGDFNQYLHDFGTEAASSKGVNSNSFEIDNAAYSTYSRITVLGAYRGIYQPQQDGILGVGAGNAIWSCVFDSWRVVGYTQNAIWLRGYNTANTGSVFRNIYITNNLSGSNIASAGPALFVMQSDEMVFEQINIEHGFFDWAAIELVTCYGPTFRGLHLEDLRLDGAASMIALSGAVKLDVSGCAIKFCNYPNDGDKAFVLVDGTGCRVRVHGVATDANTLTATNRYFARFNSSVDANTAVHATGVDTADFSAVAGGFATDIPFVKQFNNTWNHRSDGGKNVTWGTAAPTTGTWAVGDTRWNTAPAAGGAPGWMCTTAGNPGTWKAMANLAA